jgi:hypothetical protein
MGVLEFDPIAAAGHARALRGNSESFRLGASHGDTAGAVHLPDRCRDARGRIGEFGGLLDSFMRECSDEIGEVSGSITAAAEAVSGSDSLGALILQRIGIH